jgi:DHA1 family bicyclomycin/chloramphenicol resistance-like MFS transporter
LPLLACFFVIHASLGLLNPGLTALALAGHRRIAGSASALLGLGQFAAGAAAAPIAGVAGTRTAAPMAITIAALSVCAVAAFSVSARSGRVR